MRFSDRDAEHKYAYDAETLVLVLREAGFADVGRAAVWRIDRSKNGARQRR